MSLRFFLILLPAFAFGGYVIGSRLGPGAPAYHPRSEAARAQEDEQLRGAQSVDGMATLRRLAREAEGTPLGARAELALVRGLGEGPQRAAARRAFLERHPASWLRRAWMAQLSPETR